MIDTTSHQHRVRIRDPKKYKTFRTLDVGRAGHTQLVRGLNPRTGKFETQSVRFSKSDVTRRGEKLFPLDTQTKLTFMRLKSSYPKLRKVLG